MSRRWRQVFLATGGLALLTLLALAVSVYLLLQPGRFTAMLQSQAQNAGLELHLASPASPSLFPRPALDLRGITLNAQGATSPILLAARGRLALPWRTLFGGPTIITQLQIESPRVDLDALQAWVSSLPVSTHKAPPNIPRINTGVSIAGGSVVRGDDLLLDNVTLEAGSLMSGHPFPLSLSANTASGTPLDMQLSATPRIHGKALQLNDMTLQLSLGKDTTLSLKGTGHWHGAADATANLDGTLNQTGARQYKVSLQLMPAGQARPLLLTLKLDGPGNHVDMQLPPLALAQWWSRLVDPDQPQLTLPPGSGHAEIASLKTDQFSVEGLTLRTGTDVPATASSSAPATAASVYKP